MEATTFRRLLAGALGAVWVFHGGYSKLLNGIPRHRRIVERVLGPDLAPVATSTIGLGEVLLGLWVWSGRRRRACALTQTLALAGMNTAEIAQAKDLLISAPGMLALNAAFLALAWFWASPAPNERAAAVRKE
ncbi:MAG: hypothetical protein H0X40_17825 [Chthoniobacterales bacterium]|nr:hypothetical protein [Chthoniobacterales bacterium]